MFTEIIDSIVALVRDNLVVSVAVGLLIIFVTYKSFKFVFKVFLILVIVGVVLYLIMSMAATGTATKKQGLQRTSPENITSLHLRL